MPRPDGSGWRRPVKDRSNLVLLDLMLPEMSGLDVCRHIRAISDVPIIVLTAKDSEADKVAGLELGADDYVTKPFSMRELVSRVRAALRRYDMRDRRSTEVRSSAPARSRWTSTATRFGWAVALYRCGPRSSSCSRR